VRTRRARAGTAAAALVLTGVILAVWASSGGSGGSGGHATPPGDKTVASAARAGRASAVPAAESGLLPWHLAAPISREVVLPGAGGKLVVLGGLTAANTSASGVFSLDTGSGALSAVGSLRAGVHDAAGAVVGNEDLVFGGGSPGTVATVEAFGGSATIAGTLPSPRSDAAAVTIGATTYIVGGYDGSVADPTVLATTNGRTYDAVTSLPDPVRYPAVAAAGKKLYVFGGEAISGPEAGRPVPEVQVVDTVSHRSWKAGSLPEPLDGAAAVSLAGRIFLAGGESSSPQRAVPGVGTTQLGSSAGTNPGAGASGAITDAAVAPARPSASTTAATSYSVSTVWSYDPSSGRLLVAGHLQVPVSHAGVAVNGDTAWVVGGESGGSQLSAVQMITPNAAFGTAGAPGAGSPYFGAKLLVADRGNNRLLLMDPSMNVVWNYPNASSPTNSLGFYFPDDAFFIDKGTAIISNQEENETIVEIAYPSGKILWSYGHPKQAGSAPGYLHEPDDAYLLKNGDISVADAQNCRVLVLAPNGTVLHQIGTTGRCVHSPPVSIGSPNGDTPLADGNLLVSEINGSWVSEYTTSGSLVWTVHLPISYPSDPQQIGSDLYLIADYSSPGEVLEFNREGQILYRYAVSSGPGTLDHPSLAELLPSGVVMVNDDYRNRMMAFDPRTGALVWQYGINDHAGTAPGMLDTPDGFDLLMPDGSTPTHQATG
jgi:PQQ-like domain